MKKVFIGVKVIAYLFAIIGVTVLGVFIQIFLNKSDEDKGGDKTEQVAQVAQDEGGDKTEQVAQAQDNKLNNEINN